MLKLSLITADYTQAYELISKTDSTSRRWAFVVESTLKIFVKLSRSFRM